MVGNRIARRSILHFFTKIFSFLFVLLFTMSILSAAEEFVPGKIVIKFKEKSAALQTWQSAGRNGEIPELLGIIGRHDSKPYICDNLIYAVQNKLLRENKYAAMPRLNSLSRISVIEVAPSVNVVLLARKLSENSSVEYAEPMPVRKIDFTPNDPEITGQYYLNKIKAYNAWDYIDTAQVIVVGIVDTGLDINHEDIAANVFVNQGETGTDNEGNDKRSNGIDDDENGFVDDWHGWDFASGTSVTGQDNDPSPGASHGTHVSGTIGALVNNGIGVAGIVPGVRLLMVKTGSDSPYSTGIVNGYEGILYAAAMGAKVINCSWGGGFKSQAEEEVVKQIIQLDAVLVAAAGNDYIDEALYPAAYDGVMSVAATSAYDNKANFSSYNVTVDVCAPGVDILATYPGNQYGYMDGTSMSTPIAVGVTALARKAHPEYSPEQIIELVKATCDNIDALNPSYKGKLGSGRVNAFKAVSTKNPKSLIVKKVDIVDENSDGVMDPGENVDFSFIFHNVLSKVDNARAVIRSLSSIQPEFTNNQLQIGSMETGEIKNFPNAVSFIVPEDIPVDYLMDFELKVYYDSVNYKLNYFTIAFNTTYRTMNANNIAVTFNSTGNIAFNDYSTNLQGDGFTYKGSPNILFEGALMVASAMNRVSDVARGADPTYKNTAFHYTNSLKVDKPGILSAQQALTEYSDDVGIVQAGVSVIQKMYQYDTDPNQDFIIVTYNVKNISGEDIPTLYTGLYFDWDIGSSGSGDQAYYETVDSIGYIKNTTDATLPMGGTILLSPQPLNYSAIDNDGTGGINIYQGFSDAEKYMTLSSGLTSRTQSNITDASYVISGGPVQVNINETAKFAFALLSGMTLQDLKDAALHAREKYAELFPLSVGDNISENCLQVLPNPSFDGSFDLNLNLIDYARFNIKIYDIFGNCILSLGDNKALNAGLNKIQFSLAGFPGGMYFIRINSENFSAGEKIIYAK